jgi:hypothetical protein
MKSTFAIAAMEALPVDRFWRDPNGNMSPSGMASDASLCGIAINVALCSRSGHDLKRHFPRSCRRVALKAKSSVLDGEIVVPVERQLSFDDLLQRIHPAASRIKKLAEKTPALYLAFDLLKDGRAEVAAKRLSERRRVLTDFAGRLIPRSEVFRLFPASPQLNDVSRRKEFFVPQRSVRRSLDFHSVTGMAAWRCCGFAMR